MSSWYYRRLASAFHAEAFDNLEGVSLEDWAKSIDLHYAVSKPVEYSLRNFGCTKRVHYVSIDVDREIHPVTGEERKLSLGERKAVDRVLVLPQIYAYRAHFDAHLNPLFRSVLLLRRHVPDSICEEAALDRTCWCNRARTRYYDVLAKVDVERSVGMTCAGVLKVLFDSGVLQSYMRKAITDAVRERSRGLSPEMISWNYKLLRSVITTLRNDRTRWSSSADLAGAVVPFVAPGSSTSTYGFLIGLFGQQAMVGTSDLDTSQSLEEMIWALCFSRTPLHRQTRQDALLFAFMPFNQRALVYPLMYFHEREEWRAHFKYRRYVRYAETHFRYWREMVAGDMPLWKIDHTVAPRLELDDFCRLSNAHSGHWISKSWRRKVKRLAMLLLDKRVKVLAAIHLASQVFTIVSSQLMDYVLVCPNEGLSEWLSEILYPHRVYTVRQLLEQWPNSDDLPSISGKRRLAVLYAHMIGIQQWTEVLNTYRDTEIAFVTSYFGRHVYMRNPQDTGVYQREDTYGIGDVYMELLKAHPDCVTTLVDQTGTCTSDAYRVSLLAYQAIHSLSDQYACIESVSEIVSRSMTTIDVEDWLILDLLGTNATRAASNYFTKFLCINTGRLYVRDSNAASRSNVHYCQCYTVHPTACFIETRYTSYGAPDDNWLRELTERQRNFGACLLSDRPFINAASNTMKPMVGSSPTYPLIGISEYTARPVPSVLLSFRVKSLSLVDVARAAVHSTDEIALYTRNSPTSNPPYVVMRGRWPMNTRPYLFDELELDDSHESVT